MLARKNGLLAVEILTICEIQDLIPPEEQYKMNIQMQVPICRDWGWSFGMHVHLYDTKKFYNLIHKRMPLALTLNPRWASLDPEKI